MTRLLALLFLLSTSQSFSQQQSESAYQSALGLKFSGGIAASYKVFLTPTNALEAQTMFFNKGIRLIGLYEFHFYNIEGLDGLAWYVGLGAHVGFYYARYKSTYNTILDLGVDGVIGLDYHLKNFPINISIDWQPSFGLLGKPGIQPQFGGLAIRYTPQ
ncbi:MAG TPA: hypothetical protein VF622_08410 [Segetibacter sp.]|jgi:hypothetical protein